MTTYHQIMGVATSGIPRALEEIAMQYHDNTERYDRTVCTGRMMNGVAVPADSRQFSLINRNAHVERNNAIRKGQDIGYNSDVVERAIREAAAYHNYDRRVEQQQQGNRVGGRNES